MRAAVLLLLGAAAFLGALALAQAGTKTDAPRSSSGPVALQPEPAEAPARTVEAGVPLPPLSGRGRAARHSAPRQAARSAASAPAGLAEESSVPASSAPASSAPSYSPPAYSPPAEPTAPAAPPAPAPTSPPDDEGPTFYSEG
jgi:hypothetical protein